MSKEKSPQVKNEQSLKRDRRNTYGENSKSSRKNVARGKQTSEQRERNAVTERCGIDLSLEARTNDKVTDKEPMKREYRDFYNWLVGYLDGRDPVHLMGYGNPGLEYAPEASRIMPLLPKVGSEAQLAAEIYRIFVQCLGEDVVGSREQYDEIATDIYCRWTDSLEKR